MPYVYAGKYLRIDLSTGQWQAVPIADEDVRRYLLGSGYAAKLCYEELDPSIAPLDPRNTLYAFNGLLSGTFAPTGCRSSFCGRSPLTGIWNDANMGGHWGAELRFSGYDGVAVTGRAAEPVYLWIDGRKGTVALRPASHLWGLDHFAFHDAVLRETDPKAVVACIGPGGEHLVRFAGVMTGGQAHARTAGRGGMGALMGSKNLKAIVVRGQERPEYYDASAFRQTVKESNKSIQENSLSMSKMGTPGGLINAEKTGDMPLGNWRMGDRPDLAVQISGQRIAETIFVKHTFCFACPIGCGKYVEVKEGPYAGTAGHGPEYETLAGFGGMLLNDDLNSIAAMNDLCNRYGLDTISTTSAIAFAFEAYERGLLSKEDAGGLKLTWGNAEAALALVKRIAYREGLGDLLADGVRAAAKRLGPGADKFAAHVKGMEMPYHDPRAFVSIAAHYATASRGACHMEGATYWEGYGINVPGLAGELPYDKHDSRGQGRVAAHYQNYVGLYNPLGLCRFIIKGLAGPDMVADLVNAALGWGWTAQDVFLTGERLHTLKRLINVRLGVTRADDTLPERFLTEPRPAGGAAGVLPNLPLMLDEYYQYRGWDPQTGIPTAERLAVLGLSGP
ncbi:MAG: aldehyde ferredoxin oxidoreductase family protein [Anaerolineae bacterium]|nr:aldehyde ferredoxin oxidoreductase family protein [Anaerolineae bacterium]